MEERKITNTFSFHTKAEMPAPISNRKMISRKTKN